MEVGGASRDSTTTYNSTDEPLASIVTSENWKVGIYYNYCAASIGTYCYASGQGIDKNESSAIDADQDICPANWRMPTGYNYDATDRPDGAEFQKLLNKYPDIAGGDNQYTRFRNALRLPLSGHFDGGSVYNRNNTSLVWSSTFAGGGSYAASMYYLGVTTSDIGAQSSYSRSFGYSVRCIAK